MNKPDVIIDRVQYPDTITIVGGGAIHNMSLISNRVYEMGEIVFSNTIQTFPLEQQIILCYDDNYIPLDNDEHFTIIGNVKIYYGFDSFCNHSCDPNCHHIPTSDNSYQMIASRKIHIGEELTCDYAVFDTECKTHFECKCGSAICRGII